MSLELSVTIFLYFMQQVSDHQFITTYLVDIQKTNETEQKLSVFARNVSRCVCVSAEYITLSTRIFSN